MGVARRHPVRLHRTSNARRVRTRVVSRVSVAELQLPRPLVSAVFICFFALHSPLLYSSSVLLVILLIRPQLRHVLRLLETTLRTGLEAETVACFSSIASLLLRPYYA